MTLEVGEGRDEWDSDEDEPTLALADRYGKDGDKTIKNWKVAVEQDRATEDRLMNSVQVYEELASMRQDVDEDTEVTLAYSNVRQDLDQHRQSMHPGYYFVGDNVDMRTKINLGVLMKYEQYNEDMTDICEFLHTLILGHDSTDDWQKNPDKVLSGGDYLTFVIWSQLYNTNSARSQGTLYAARTTLNARNVTQHSSQDFYACSDLVEKVTIAYIVTGGLWYFGMSSLNSVPTKNVYDGPIGDKKEMCAHILFHASEFAKQYCVPDTPLLPEYEYKRPKSLREHETEVHGHPDPLYGNTRVTEITTCVSDDGVHNYTRLMLNLGQLRMNHNDAIRMGDGERIMRINQFLVLFYKACNCPKYAYGILETIAQTKVLLTERMACRLTWNRTVNHRGECDSNHPNDLDLEHCNKVFKDEAHSFRGTFTEKTVSRVRRSALSLQSAYQQLDLFSILPGRLHDSSFQMSKSPLSLLDMDEVRNWISASLVDYKRTHG
ncbi:uncharacterized protein LOC125676678 [Ostrea edulis]|uniref:uncharacterized protein LOC125676678 n=1 Tax=Ostrea edulis TaxID=37623 RepID=UPI0024AF1454|nr:uncharacterized protein LOC125676678 [Ostrea edulis]